MTGEDSTEIGECGVTCHVKKQMVLDGRGRQVYVRVGTNENDSDVQSAKRKEKNELGNSHGAFRNNKASDFSWVWDNGTKSHDVVLCNCNCEVYFHPDYSCGTAAVRGNSLLRGDKEHYWEIKMTSAVYGTDMMIGVGTHSLNLDKFKSQYCSLIGRDGESWGLSYFGTFHSNGKSKHFAKKFDRDTVIGVHLDMWKGTLSFYRDGEPLGVAADLLKDKYLYPIVSSTAARTKMKLLCSHTTNFSLQLLCCKVIFRCIANKLDKVQNLPLPEHLKDYLSMQMKWLPKVDPRINFHEPVPNRLKR